MSNNVSAPTDPNVIREDVLKHLGAICELINAARDQGIKIEFALSTNAQGHMSVASFQVWQLLKGN